MSRGDGIASEDLLGGVDPAFLAAVVPHGRERRLAAGEVLFAQDDPADDLFVVLDGQVTIASRPPGLVPVVLAVLGRPAVFGTGALLGPGATRRSEAVAQGPSRVLAVPVAVVQREAVAHPTAALAIARALAAQVLASSDRLAEALQLAAPDRVRRRLHALAAVAPDGVVTVTQPVLAGLAGTSRATVSRVLQELAAAGVVRHRRGAIEVLDPEALLVPDDVTGASSRVQVDR